MQCKSRSYRVAVVGSGPSAMYAAEHLLENRGTSFEVDIFERLPTPWGLVRAGVAPDHPEKKLIADRLFSYILDRSEVRFFGNVEVGKDIQHQDLVQWYDATIYASGVTADAELNIPGEQLSGCWGAREFVAWYNGHPDASELNFNFSSERAVIIGNGNVALDVARVLTMPYQRLINTDIADYALDALKDSNIQEVIILGRRGAAQAAFNNPELEELGDLPGVEVVIRGDQSLSDKAHADVKLDWTTRRKLRTLQRLSTLKPAGQRKRIVLQFLSSPLEVVGNNSVSHLRVADNKLELQSDGILRPVATGTERDIECGLIVRATGYRGTPFPGLPFDPQRSVIRNEGGRIVDEEILSGVYVTGWIKRGPRGVIGTNRKCARDTVGALLDDLYGNRLSLSSYDGTQVANEIALRQPNLVTKGMWGNIDSIERQLGRSQGRPRVKFTSIEAMLASVDRA